MMFRASWSITSKTGEYLEKITWGKNFYVLEFGTGTGRATEILAKHTRQVITLDASREYSEYTKERLKHLDNIKYHVGYKPSTTNADLLFIDGPKGGKARRETLIKWWSYLKDGIVIVVDDAVRDEEATLVPWKELWGIDYRILPIDRGIGVFKKETI